MYIALFLTEMFQYWNHENMSAHYKCLDEVILMSTHNICFHEEIKKNI